MARRRRARFTEADPTDALIREVRSLSQSQYGWEELDPLMERIGDSRWAVLSTKCRKLSRLECKFDFSFATREA